MRSPGLLLNQERVEAEGLVGEMPVLRDKEHRGFDNLALFVGRYGALGTTEKECFAKLHLDKADGFILLHNQIDFAKTTTVILI